MDSGELRNTYCPDSRIEWAKRFVTGTEPKSWCRFHKASSPVTTTTTIPTTTTTTTTTTTLPPPIDERKLSMFNGKLYYGDKPIHLCGVSRLEALWRFTGEHNWPGWGDKYSQGQYEKDLIDSGINYVRHLGIKNTQVLYDHCKRMKDAGIIVEVGVYWVNSNDWGTLVNLEDMGDLAKLGNVFFDCCNEFIGNDQTEIATVINIIKNLKAQGCLVSAGAWSGPDGKALSDIFHSQSSYQHIETHHREWTVDSFNETLAHRKPVVFSEYFSQGNLTLDQTKAIMKTAFDMGIHVNYYGWRDIKLGLPGLTKYDPFPYKSILTYAGKLAKGG